MNIYAVHDSFDERFRSPKGARPIDDKILLSLFSTVNACVYLCTWHENVYNEQPMQKASYHLGSRAGYMYSANICVPCAPCLLFYCFKINVCGETHYYCGKHGEGFTTNSPVLAYQITVYAPHELPLRYKNGIVYQIFPDRFNRGNVSGGLPRIHTHTNMGKPVFVHENWQDEVNFLPLPHEENYYPCDFFCGDLKGIEEKLPYLLSLGINYIYLNPIFEAQSNHRYDTANYMKIDGILGDDKTFFTLQEKCNENGINIILDGVFSHTGADSVYFNRYNRYGNAGAYNDKESEYYEWYSFEKYPEKYKAWWGFEDMPEVDEDNESYRSFIKGVLLKWHSSWRLDVADELTDDFIRFLRKEVKSIDSDAVVIGEVWEDASDKHSKGMRRGYTDGDELDGVMNYPLRQNIIDFLLEKIDAGDFVYNMKCLCESYPDEFMCGCLNILSSHDTVRILTVLCNAPERDVLSKSEQANVYFSGKELTNGIKKVILAIVVQFAMKGVPCIYYGDEIGMQGMADPFCRRTMNFALTDDNYLLESVRAIAEKYKRCSAFSGDMRLFCSSNDVLIIERYSCDASAYGIVNRSNAVQRIKIDTREKSTVYVDALSQKTYCAYKNAIELTLNAYEGAFLVSI